MYYFSIYTLHIICTLWMYIYMCIYTHYTYYIYISSVELSPHLAASSYWVGTSDLQRSASAASSEHVPRASSRFSHHLRSDQFTLVIYLLYRGGWNPIQLYGDCFISHEIRIPELNHQDSMECPQGFFERCSFGKSSKSKFSLGFIPLGIQSYLVGGFNPFEKY